MAEQHVFSIQECLSHARGTEWSEYTAGTTSATASHAATSGARHKITWATFWSDTDSIISILAGSAGTTVIWEGKLDIGVDGFMKHVIFPTPLFGTVSVKVEAKVTSGTSDCGATFGGFSTKVI